ncbi:MAG: hypothetical protein V1740_00905 [Candidatus Woesearchaeota archaeon]
MPDLMLETILDCLAEGYKRLEKWTFQEASEVQNQRRTTDPDLRVKCVYTANLFLFRVSDSNLEYGLGGRQAFDSVAGADIDRFSGEILKSEGHVYTLTESQLQLLSGFDIDWALASELGLIRKNDEWSYVPVNTSDVRAERLSDVVRPFAVKAHGSLTAKYDPKQEFPDYGENMNMLREDGEVERTRLWFPTETHIERFIPEGGVVARASRLLNFLDDSSFVAGHRVVGDRGALRGVQIVGEADSKKIQEVAALLAKPRAQEIMAASLTPATIGGYEAVGALYRGKCQES